MKTSIIYGLLVVFVTAQYACNKQLDALPDQAKVDGNLITDQKSAEVALNGVYYLLAASGKDFCNNHELTPSWTAGNLEYLFGTTALTDNILNSTSTEVNYIWVESYAEINAANGFIKQAEALPASKYSGNRKTEMLAEAHFIRAYGHYKLLSFYGQYYDMTSPYGALLRKEFVKVNNISEARSTVKDSYDFILADLDDAIANAPLQNKNYYVTRWAAKALKARILMSRGATGDYADVISLTQDIIQNGPYTLEPNLKDLFAIKGLDSKEVILGTTPVVNQASKTNVYFNPFFGASYIPTARFKALLQGDPRNSWVIGDVNGVIGITKYQGPQLEVSYIFRLTEMYLLQAEAIVRSGGDTDLAKTLLKTVMQHAGVTDFTAVDAANTPDKLLREIYNETVRNLVYEDGQDWFALQRLPLATVTSIKSSITSKDQYIFPIPQTEFQRNQSIGDQNPGYDK